MEYSLAASRTGPRILFACCRHNERCTNVRTWAGALRVWSNDASASEEHSEVGVARRFSLGRLPESRRSCLHRAPTPLVPFDWPSMALSIVTLAFTWPNRLLPDPPAQDPVRADSPG